MVDDCQDDATPQSPSPGPDPIDPGPIDLEIVFPNDGLVQQALANCPQDCLIINAKDEELDINAGKGSFGLIIQGTDGCDCIIGTEGPDVIYGYGGGKHRE